MPNARTHQDMLQVCCGICGIKKNPNQLRKITENILSKIKQINGYNDYNLYDERYPKVICESHINAVYDKIKNPTSTRFNFPENLPPFKDITLPHASTRTTPTGYNEDHSCFLCDQNVVGRPKENKESVSSKKHCSLCYQPIGRGISHPCKTSTKKTVQLLTNTIQSMDAKIKDRVTGNIIKSKYDSNTPSPSQVLNLHTAGRSTRVLINPKLNKDSNIVSKNTLDQIRTQAGLSIRQTNLLTGGLRTNLGRSVIPPYYREHVSESNHLLDKFYKHEKINFIGGDSSETKDFWAVWASMCPLIEVIISARNLNPQDKYFIKIMGDSGQNKTKICFLVMPLEDPFSLVRKRHTYAEGGSLGRGFQYSGINKCIMSFCAPVIKETYTNLQKIFELIKVEEVFMKFENVIFTGDLKFLNEMYGIMEGSSRHPCLYCTAVA